MWDPFITCTPSTTPSSSKLQDDDWCFMAHFCAHGTLKWVEWSPKAMKQSQRWNTLQIYHTEIRTQNCRNPTDWQRGATEAINSVTWYNYYINLLHNRVLITQTPQQICLFNKYQKADINIHGLGKFFV